MLVKNFGEQKSIHPHMTNGELTSSFRSSWFSLKQLDLYYFDLHYFVSFYNVPSWQEFCYPTEANSGQHFGGQKSIHPHITNGDLTSSFWLKFIFIETTRLTLFWLALSCFLLQCCSPMTRILLSNRSKCHQKNTNIWQRKTKKPRCWKRMISEWNECLQESDPKGYGCGRRGINPEGCGCGW